MIRTKSAGRFARHALSQFSHKTEGVAVNRSNFSGRKNRGRTFGSNCRDRMECCRILSYLLYGSVDSGRFGKRRFVRNMAADVSAKKIWRNVSG